MRRARGRVRTALLDRRPRGGVGQYPGRGVPRHLGCVQGRGHPRALSAAGCAADGRGRTRRAAVVLPLLLAIAAPAFSGVEWTGNHPSAYFARSTPARMIAFTSSTSPQPTRFPHFQKTRNPSGGEQVIQPVYLSGV